MINQIIGLFLLINYGNAFIVPQEVPSILSLVYSNIPPIKKGTDSKVGFGYRLGEHADFQVVFELGPQTNTKPLGSGSDSSDSDNSKRNVNQEDYNKIKSPNPDGTEYLSNWSQDMKMKGKKVLPPEPAANGKAPTQQQHTIMQTVPFISESALKQLQQLYKNPQPLNQQDLESIGTLPASSMEDAIVTSENRERFNIIVPSNANKGLFSSNNQQSSTMNIKDKRKVTADLMDVGLDNFK